MATPDVNSKCNTHKTKSREAPPSTSIPNKTTNHTPPKNELVDEQSRFLESIPKQTRDNFFSPSAVDPTTRAEIWMKQADLGETLVDRYAWATPDLRAIQVLRHFAPIVEIGAGANAYWANLMHRHGIDVIAYDIDPKRGGKIDQSSTDRRNNNNNKRSNQKTHHDSIKVQKGGPKMLSSNPMIRQSNRTLFLCYPDEHVDESQPETSLGTACLRHYRGEHIIHVGELYSDTISVSQSPWGRSTSSQFQQQLVTEYHCLIKLSLPGWLHVRDTISVWKKSTMCSIVFQADEDDDTSEDEEVEYKHIPVEERLNVDVAAPCLAHLLKHPDLEHTQGQKPDASKVEQNKSKKTKKRKNK